ncbi:MAG TPA: hypothetical protein VE988_20170, partial [Gemmataceae bacterium]|nr:hypothetical protein [Gemmataceae bacterium]
VVREPAAMAAGCRGHGFSSSRCCADDLQHALARSGRVRVQDSELVISSVWLAEKNKKYQIIYCKGKPSM